MAISAVADANPREAVAVDTFPDGGETSMSNEQPAEEIAAVTNISTDGLLHDLLRPRALPVLQASESELAVSCGVGEEPLALLGTRCRLPAVQQPLAMSDLEVVNILRRWKNKDDVRPTFVHQLDLYACPPWEVVKGLEYAPRVTTKHGQGEKTWFFIGSEYGERHGRRKVGGGRGTWHGEGGAHPILGADGKSVVAYKKRFSYKKRTVPGKSGEQQRTGWIMMQISLDKDTEGADQNHQTVICMIYKSNHKYAAAETSSTAASSYAGALTKGKAVALAAVAEEALLDGREKAAATELSLIDLLLKAAGKAVYYGDFKNACQIPEFVAAKKMCLTTIRELGLDSSILSDPFSRLDLHLQHVAMTKELTPNERDHIVCLGKRMSVTIFSEYLNELGKRARQAFNALDQRLGVNVQEALQRASKMTNVSLVVHDSEAKDSVQFLLSAFLGGFASKVEEAAAENNKRPIPASFTTASGSGIKRKADGGGHAEEPPGLRQARTETCPTLVDPVGMPGVADNPEDPVGVHGFPAGVVAPQVEADHSWADLLNRLRDDDAWPGHLSL